MAPIQSFSTAMPPKTKTKQFRTASSLVNVVDEAGKTRSRFTIWSSKGPGIDKNGDVLFVKCLTQPGSTLKDIKVKQIEPKDPKEEVYTVVQADAYNLNENLNYEDVSDIGNLPHKNDACVLEFLRARMKLGLIYSSADPLLVAVNPFKDLKNATDAHIMGYRDAPDAARLAPHIFKTARVALDTLHGVKKSQTVIVSGESGAGKTEATKQIMRYFASAKTGGIDLRIQKAVLAANPVLEAFGNAKTTNNNNSSRFGRFMMLDVVKGGGIRHGKVQNFLLEKSRVVMQDSSERSYHIFYQLLKGASPESRRDLKLLGLKEYAMLNPNCADADGIDDVADFKEVTRAFDTMQLTKQEQDQILKIVSGVLLLGNAKIDGVSRDGLSDAAEICKSTKRHLLDACELLALNVEAVEDAICRKHMKIGESVVHSSFDKSTAEMLRGSLSKGLYDALFSWIVKKLNVNIEPESGFTHFMGMLDIFGFEVFPNNSLEQLFINITNEKLQKNFIDVVFDRETKLYRAEGISDAKIDWTTNDAVINMLTGRQSLMSVLEDQCLVSGGTDEKMLSTAKQALKNEVTFVCGKYGSEDKFTVEHTIGLIDYMIKDFIFKNRDVLRAELIDVIQASPNPVTSDLFDGVKKEKGKLAKGELIGSQFLLQLNSLMGIINSTEPHFVRCIKPNDLKRPLTFHDAKVLVQLYALSVMDALKLKELGFSYRREFEEFIQQYKFVNLGLASGSEDSRIRAEKMVACTKVKNADYRIGKTMIFMKPSAVKRVDEAQRDALSAWVPIVNIIEAIKEKQSLRKSYLGRRNNTVRVQALCRRYIATKGLSVKPRGYDETLRAAF